MYFHSPNTTTLISACVRCKMMAVIRLYLTLVKAFTVMWLWLERPHVWYAKKADQKTVIWV